MKEYKEYPVLEIDLNGIYHNAKAVADMCAEKGMNAPVFLIRVPMMTEFADVMTYTDASLNSELQAVEKMNEICGRN